MNRQTKRQMARQGQGDGTRPPDRRSAAPNPQRERTSPGQYFSEVRGEMKKVAWPPREETFNSTLVVIVGLVVMTALIFFFDQLAIKIVNYIFT